MGVDTVADGLCCFYQTQTTGQDPAPTLIMSDSSMTFPSASSVRVEDPHRGNVAFQSCLECAHRFALKPNLSHS